MHTSFTDSDVLGKFNAGRCVIESLQEQVSASVKATNEELKAAFQEIERLKADLLECREYIEEHVDVIDGSNGEPMPNRAMDLVSMIDESLHGAGNF